ncbi:MAG: hypothetical protein RLZZ180_1560 [Pseudomonadota bacterium]|jgi:uncharacterized protein (DUF2147 family)
MTRFFFAAALLAAGPALAQMTPVGLWRSIDDQTGQARAEISIKDNGRGGLNGKVERSLQAVASPEPNCNLCTDDRKGQPKIGLEIIRDAKKSGSEPLWEGGTILDPENGKVYKLRLSPQDGGKTLQVRGYIGPFFRTQLWQRVQ